MLKTWTDQAETIKHAYQEMCDGEDPWIPLGNFTNDFFSQADSNWRMELIKDPLEEAEVTNTDLHRWAVFCAASVEYLCQKYALPVPVWVYASTYNALPIPWYFSDVADRKPRVRERLEHETPEPFSRRNIYCGDRVFLDKRQEAEKLRQRLSA